MTDSPDLFQTARIKELATLIEKYQKSYYNGESEITDAEFDALWDELRQLDSEHPVLHRIGADSGNFAKVAHRIPMGSQEKAADPEEFAAWAEKHIYPEYLVEYKLDGASIELQYDNGIFSRAVTRGNGTVGDDITANVRKMQGIRHRLEQDGKLVPVTGGIRGEVIMPREIHRKLYADKANCRNAANGLMKRKDGSGSEHLQIICYDALFDGFPFDDEEKKLRWLDSCGFTTVPLKICTSVQDVTAYRAEVMELRPALPYDIDGLVVKERRVDIADASRARPDRQIAYKFSLEEAVSVVRDVEWSVSGATYTPVAVFDPVELAGTTVKRASLVNPNTIRTLGICIGSHVVVTKRGEIIPKIEAVVPRKNESGVTPVPFPGNCINCGTPLQDDGTRLYCPNRGCPQRILHRLEKWIDVLDIRDFGTTLIHSLFDTGRVRSIYDLYTLTEDDLTAYFLNEESIQKEKKSLGAAKVLKSLHSRTRITLPVFIAGFDIEGIGETLMEKLTSSGFDTFDKLLAASENDIAEVSGFGEITAATLLNGLQENKAEMQLLISSKTIHIQEPDNGILAGKSFCFTGELSVKRSEAEKMVKDKGGSVKSSVGKGLSYLVTNDTSSGSAKNKKAAELGIPVIDEAAFFRLLEQKTQ